MKPSARAAEEVAIRSRRKVVPNKTSYDGNATISSLIRVAQARSSTVKPSAREELEDSGTGILSFGRHDSAEEASKSDRLHCRHQQLQKGGRRQLVLPGGRHSIWRLTLLLSSASPGVGERRKSSPPLSSLV